MTYDQITDTFGSPYLDFYAGVDSSYFGYLEIYEDDTCYYCGFDGGFTKLTFEQTSGELLDIEMIDIRGRVFALQPKMGDASGVPIAA